MSHRIPIGYFSKSCILRNKNVQELSGGNIKGNGNELFEKLEGTLALKLDW